MHFTAGMYTLQAGIDFRMHHIVPPKATSTMNFVRLRRVSAILRRQLWRSIEDLVVAVHDFPRARISSLRRTVAASHPLDVLLNDLLRGGPDEHRQS
jgi:hypothetical protein